MPLPATQLRECLGAVGAFIEKRRPALEVRDKLDYRADITGSEVVLVSVRSAYDDKTVKIDHPIAKAKWVGTQGVWRLFWMRADMKWHAYQPLPEAPELETVLAEVNRDPHGCFFG